MGEQFNLEDLVYIEVKCKTCGEMGQSPTFKQILEKKDSPLVRQIEEYGYAVIECGGCHGKKAQKEQQE